MKHSLFLLRIPCILWIIATCAGQSTMVQVGATVQNISLDPSKSTATVRILNNSSKDISAYTLAIDLTFAKGKTIHDERLEDYLPIPENANKLWHPGTTRELAVSAGTSDPIAKTEAKVVAIIYTDRTADVDDEAAYQRMIDSRKERASAMVQAANAIQAALADPNPSQEASASVRHLLGDAKASGKGNVNGELTVILQALQDAPKTAARHGISEAEYLRKYSAELTRLASASAEQADVRRNP